MGIKTTSQELCGICKMNIRRVFVAQYAIMSPQYQFALLWNILQLHHYESAIDLVLPSGENGGMNLAEKLNSVRYAQRTDRDFRLALDAALRAIYNVPLTVDDVENTRNYLKKIKPFFTDWYENVTKNPVERS